MWLTTFFTLPQGEQKALGTAVGKQHFQLEKK
jgi:hypothetical protein